MSTPTDQMGFAQSLMSPIDWGASTFPDMNPNVSNAPVTAQSLMPQIFASSATPGGIPQTTPSTMASAADLSPIVVTAQKITMPPMVGGGTLADWLKPPKLWLLLAIGAGGVLLWKSSKKRRKRR